MTRIAIARERNGMNDLNRTSVATRPHPGRAYLALALLLAVAGPVLYAVQWQARALSTPWYVPILATLGVVLAVVALLRSRSVWRWVATVLLALFAAWVWVVLLVLLGTPAYTGHVKAGEPFPDFTSTLADGSPFDQKSLTGDQNTVLVFFRGRW
jgi:hypothetical protein